jgi:hypothetical protein
LLEEVEAVDPENETSTYTLCGQNAVVLNVKADAIRGQLTNRFPTKH